MSFQTAQRVLSSHFCSTSSSSAQDPRADRGVFSCVGSTAEHPRSEPRQRSHVRRDWIGLGCPLPNLPRGPHRPVSSSNGSGPAVMQGLGSSVPKQRTMGATGLQEEPFDCTEFVAETLLPTLSGKYRLRGYRHTFDGGRTYTEPSCIMTGNPEGLENVPVRVHDACFTSEVLGSLKCDCAGQLQMAMGYIQQNSPGVIIYLQQEGRGIGLANKIAAYALQEEGLDTVDANRALGLPDDCREYSSVKNILNDLGIKSIRLMTNNPRKIQVLQELGVDVTGRIPCIVESQELNVGYLATKQSRMQHWLSESDSDSLDGSFCYWNHDGEPLLPLAAENGTKGGNGRPISRPATD